MPRVENGRDASLAVLSFFLVPFLILSEDSFFHPIFIDQYLDLKRFQIGCPIRDN